MGVKASSTQQQLDRVGPSTDRDEQWRSSLNELVTLKNALHPRRKICSGGWWRAEQSHAGRARSSRARGQPQHAHVFIDEFI